MPDKLLRYRISDWSQLPGCLSNNSKDLSLHVSNFYKISTLDGIRISVEHAMYGVLFACVLNASGEIITPESSDPNIPYTSYNVSTDVILKELEKYGFFIEYSNSFKLPVEQLEYLSTLDELQFDKIRHINVCDPYSQSSKSNVHLILFMASNHPKLLDNSYRMTTNDFISGLTSGTILDITAMSNRKKFRWDWLDYVGNISDILRVHTTNPPKEVIEDAG